MQLLATPSARGSSTPGSSLLEVDGSLEDFIKACSLLCRTNYRFFCTRLPPPKVCLRSRLMVHEIYIQRLALASARAFPSAQGFALSSAREYLPRPGHPLWPKWMNDSWMDIRPRVLVEMYYQCGRWIDRHTAVRFFLSSARGIIYGRAGSIYH